MENVDEHLPFSEMDMKGLVTIDFIQNGRVLTFSVTTIDTAIVQL